MQNVHEWAKANWLNITAAIGAAAAVITVPVPFIIRWLDRRSTKAIEALGGERRLVMLRRVRFKWVKGVLEPSLARAARLVLGLDSRPDALDLGGRIRHRPGRRPQPLPVGSPIVDLFDQVGGTLLILGAPGSGKTTLLLQLAEQLLGRAERDPDQPIPVVFNLSSWAHERAPLAAWLVGELIMSYQVPRLIAQDWVERDALALLLDGLDEVAEAHRNKCAEAVNGYRQEHGLVPLALCSRTQELLALNTQLRLEEAVELQPPSDAQVETYLGYLESTGTPLAEVRSAMESDESLRKLLRSPLTLHVIALAYHGRPALAVQGPGSPEQRQARLWEAYLDRMFEQRRLDPRSGYTTAQARRWLAWLACALRDRDQTEFQLDRLTSDWVPAPMWRPFVRLIIAVIAALIVGLTALLAFGLAFGLNWGLTVGLFLGLVSGLDAWGSYASRIFKHQHAIGTVPPIYPIEQVRWSWTKLRRGLPIGLVGTICCLGVGLVAGAGVGWATGLGVWLGVGLVGGLTFTLDDRRAEPNEGIRRSLRHALTVWLGGGLGTGIVGALAVATLGAQREELVVGFGAGTAGGLAGGLATGILAGTAIGINPCSQHLAVRALLFITGAAPWRYGLFLEAMAERLLLRRSGSAYLFIHRLLRDYLADLAAMPALPPASPD
jgi:hypothetical protein